MLLPPLGGVEMFHGLELVLLEKHGMMLVVLLKVLLELSHAKLVLAQYYLQMPNLKQQWVKKQLAQPVTENVHLLQVRLLPNAV
jgi:hypothetical protein